MGSFKVRETLGSDPIGSERLHYWAALRYVEQNPVRAGIVAAPQDWEWGSAPDHLGLRSISPEYLGLEAASATQALRLATRNGWPLGGEELQAAARQHSLRAVSPEHGGRPAAAWLG